MSWRRGRRDVGTRRLRLFYQVNRSGLARFSPAGQNNIRALDVILSFVLASVVKE